MSGPGGTVPVDGSGGSGAGAPGRPGTGAETDTAVARRLAGRAGEWLLALRAGMGHDQPARLRAAGDRGAHELIVGELAACRPADAVLSEEGADDPARLVADRVWIVDPLDGTREFGERGRDDWAVHIALWVRDSPAPFHLAGGAIALPARGLVLGTDPAPPAPSRPAGAPPRLVASRSRPPRFLPAVAREIGAGVTSLGSAGAKIAAVVTGDVDGYVHAGGQHEWDSAAPVAVAVAAGLHASRLDGSALRYNQPDTNLPDLVVCRRELAGRLLAAIARYA